MGRLPPEPGGAPTVGQNTGKKRKREPEAPAVPMVFRLTRDDAPTSNYGLWPITSKLGIDEKGVWFKEDRYGREDYMGLAWIPPELWDGPKLEPGDGSIVVKLAAQEIRLKT